MTAAPAAGCGIIRLRQGDVLRRVLVCAGMLAPGLAAAQVKVLHAFPAYPADGTENDGTNSAPLLMDASGALYGATAAGGTSTGLAGGTIFKLTPPAPGQSGWTETILHDFHGPDGDSPLGGLVMDRSGALYGTAYDGGSLGGGTVFKLKPPAAGKTAWTLQTLLDLGSTKFGSFPFGGLTIDASGALYGTDLDGVIFKLSPPKTGSGAWTAAKLATIAGGSEGTLTAGPGGVLYGTALQDDPQGYPGPGWVFAATPPGAAGGNWRVQAISWLPVGENPEAGLLLDSSGALYGTAPAGGNAKSCGLVFKLTRPETGTLWTETVVHAFSGPDGCQPASNLVEDKAGALYGTTIYGGKGAGVVYKLSLRNGAWTEQVIASLDDATGGYPMAAVTFDAAGNIYGLTSALGAHGNDSGGGTVFQIPAADNPPRGRAEP